MSAISSSYDWVERAKETLLDVLADQHVVTMRELEARASDRTWPGTGYKIDPHHFTEAKQQLISSGAIEETSVRSRGKAAQVAVLHLPRQRGRSTLIDTVAARKRLLTSRHQGWATGSTRHPQGLIGPAGELAVHQALLDASEFVTHPERREVHRVFGTDLRPFGGPVDSLAYLVEAENGPPVTYTCLVEVKNQRQWIYPEEQQLHRFLAKAAQLQNLHPTTPIIPIFVCRRKHYTLQQMAKALGFYAIEVRTQWVLDSYLVDPDSLAEVVSELGYEDLVRGTTPNKALRRALETLPGVAAATAQRWQESALWMVDHYRDGAQGVLNIDLMRELADSQGFGTGGW